MKYDCELNDYKTESKCSLKDHIRSQHHKDMFSQVESNCEAKIEESFLQPTFATIVESLLNQRLI